MSVNTSRVLIKSKGLCKPNLKDSMWIWHSPHQLQRKNPDHLSNSFVNPVLARSLSFHSFHWRVTSWKEIPRIWLPYDRKFSFKWSWSQSEFVNETLTFRAMAVRSIVKYAGVRTFSFYSSFKNKISSRIKVLEYLLECHRAKSSGIKLS